MKVSLKRGFTIIEVTLVLAITSLLAMAIIATVQASIKSQHYNDSVDSLKNFLQDQYNKVNTPDVLETDRLKECGADATDFGDASYRKRGRTGCLFLGRLLTFSNSGGDSKISVDRIIATKDYSINDLSSKNDSGLFSEKDYLAKATDVASETYYLAWDAFVTSPKSNDLLTAQILILRSPINGSIRTYISLDSGLSLSQLATSANLNNDLKMCVYPKGISFKATRAVVLRANGSSSTAVEIAPRDEVINGVQPVKC